MCIRQLRREGGWIRPWHPHEPVIERVYEAASTHMPNIAGTAWAWDLSAALGWARPGAAASPPGAWLEHSDTPWRAAGARPDAAPMPLATFPVPCSNPFTYTTMFPGEAACDFVCWSVTPYPESLPGSGGGGPDMHAADALEGELADGANFQWSLRGISQLVFARVLAPSE